MSVEKKKTQSAPVYILVESINGVKIARGFFSLQFHFQYGRRHLFQFNCVCNLRSCNHSDGPVQPLHKQQLGGSSYPRPFLCPHPVWICLLPLQAQVSSSLPVNLPDSREEYKKKNVPLWHVTALVCLAQLYIYIFRIENEMKATALKTNRRICVFINSPYLSC